MVLSMDRPTRKLTAEETAVVEELYRRKNRHGSCHGYITTAAPVPMGSKDGKGPWGGNPARIIPAGQTLKIVMVSRFGDAGLTDNLEADYGYEVRLDWEDAAMKDIRLTRNTQNNVSTTPVR